MKVNITQRDVIKIELSNDSVVFLIVIWGITLGVDDEVPLSTIINNCDCWGIVLLI
ncbi:MAG: hypothetical protein ACLRQF_01680 [Thomasclavelia ramosa]